MNNIIIYQKGHLYLQSWSDIIVDIVTGRALDVTTCYLCTRSKISAALGLSVSKRMITSDNPQVYEWLKDRHTSK